MTRKVKLLIDMDGVQCDWYGTLLDLYKAKYPDRPTVAPEDLEHFYVEHQYPEEHKDDLLRIVRTEGFYLNMKPMPGAIEALKDISENCLDFIEPFICTAPELDFNNLMCHTEKAQWVRENLGEFWLKRLIITKDKTIVDGDYLIDDKPEIKGVCIPNWTQIHYEHNYTPVDADYRFTWEKWKELKLDLYAEANTRKFLI